MGHDRLTHHHLHTGAVLVDGLHAQRNTARGSDDNSHGREGKET